MGKVTVNLFGAFRRYGNGRSIELSIDREVSVDALREILKAKFLEVEPGFKDAGLLQDSAFANSKCVLKGFDLIKEGEALAILPPVCGG